MNKVMKIVDNIDARIDSMLPQTPEAIRKRKRSLIVLGGATLAGLLIWGGIHQGIEQHNAELSDEKADLASEAYVSAIKAASLEFADPANIIGAPMIDNGQTQRIYDQAMDQLKALGLDDTENINATSVDITSKYISSSNLIQPDSIFVLSKSDFDNNGTTDVIVQIAPEGYPVDGLQLNTLSDD